MPSVPPEKQLEIVKKFVRGRCWNHPDWDSGDLEGKILEDLTRWPPSYPGEVVRRCQFGYADWMKRRMGGDGKGERPNKVTDYTVETTTLDYQLTPTLTVVEVTPGDEDAVDWDAELSFDLLQHFHPREQVVLELLVEGYNMSQIAQVLETSKANISRLVAGVRPRLVELLNVPA